MDAAVTFSLPSPGSLTATAVVEADAAAPAVVLGVHLRIVWTDPSTLQVHEVLPVLWDDNFFHLLPGERRTIHADIPEEALHAGQLMMPSWTGRQRTAGCWSASRRRDAQRGLGFRVRVCCT